MINFNQDLVNRVKEFKRDQYKMAAASRKMNAPITAINQIEMKGDLAVSRLNNVSTFLANANESSYPEDVRSEFMSLAKDQYEELISLIGEF